jgi:acyl carrier protein
MTESLCGERVRSLVRDMARPAFKTAALSDDLEILGGGLRFDSIAYAELLFACEEAFGMTFPDAWATKTRLTIGELVSYIRAAVD